jgi:cell fate (sporulation/competence/biofilm development) regulator YlbF (YheA/YmcA/DUF963 family)
MAIAASSDKFRPIGVHQLKLKIMKMTRTLTLVMALSVIPMTPAFGGDNKSTDNLGQQETPAANPDDLVGKVNGLAQMIIDLEESGHLTHAQTHSLLQKLAKAQKALQTDDAVATTSPEASALQSVLGNLSKAVKALTDFLRELTKIVTDLPAEVVQPIINATLDLIDQLVGLLLP